MRIGTLIREAWASVWASKVPSVLCAVVVAAMCVASIVTVGKSASAAAAMAARLEQAGARQLAVIDSQAQGFITEMALEQVTSLNTVVAANSLGIPMDVTNGDIGRGGTKVPAWTVYGSLENLGGIVRGRAPEPGEAIVSVEAMRGLGLAEPVGFVVNSAGEQFPVVGAFRAKEPFDDLATGIVINPENVAPAREIRVVISDMSAARVTVNAVLSILKPPDIQGVHIESPTSLADTAADLNAQLANYGRSLLLLILGAGSFFVMAVVFADVLVRRRDLGRRRTLGGTRSDLAALVTIRTAFTAAIGAAVGCALAWLINWFSDGIATPLDFTLAVGVLAVLVAIVAGIPPAVFAARRDPVAVMRTP